MLVGSSMWHQKDEHDAYLLLVKLAQTTIGGDLEVTGAFTSVFSAAQSLSLNETVVQWHASRCFHKALYLITHRNLYHKEKSNNFFTVLK